MRLAREETEGLNRLRNGLRHSESLGSVRCVHRVLGCPRKIAGVHMNPTDADQAEEGMPEPKRDDSQQKQEPRILTSVKAVAQRIQERVDQVLHDTDPVPPTADAPPQE